MHSAPFDAIDPLEERLTAHVRAWTDRAIVPIDAADIARQAAADHTRATGLRARLAGAHATASAAANAPSTGDVPTDALRHPLHRRDRHRRPRHGGAVLRGGTEPVAHANSGTGKRIAAADTVTADTDASGRPAAGPSAAGAGYPAGCAERLHRHATRPGALGARQRGRDEPAAGDGSDRLVVGLGLP